jgi:hypothetical protein
MGTKYVNLLNFFIKTKKTAAVCLNPYPLKRKTVKILFFLKNSHFVEKIGTSIFFYISEHFIRNLYYV